MSFSNSLFKLILLAVYDNFFCDSQTFFWPLRQNKKYKRRLIYSFLRYSQSYCIFKLLILLMSKISRSCQSNYCLNRLTYISARTDINIILYIVPFFVASIRILRGISTGVYLKLHYILYYHYLYYTAKNIVIFRKRYYIAFLGTIKWHFGRNFFQN